MSQRKMHVFARDALRYRKRLTYSRASPPKRGPDRAATTSKVSPRCKAFGADIDAPACAAVSTLCRAPRCLRPRGLAQWRRAISRPAMSRC